MDTFIDKLAQKKNAQEMIRANMTAEAEQMQSQIKAYDELMQNQMKTHDELMQEIRQVNLKTAENTAEMQNQMKAYDELMQEIRQVNLKTAENAAEVRNTLKDCIDRLEVMQAENSRAAEAEAEELKQEQEQRKQEQEQWKQQQEQALAQIKTLLEEKFQQSDDFLHKENVKVYRNVQAALVEELNKQSEEIKNSQVKNRGSKAVLPISILILLGIIADILIQLFSFKIVF